MFTNFTLWFSHKILEFFSRFYPRHLPPQPLRSSKMATHVASFIQSSISAPSDCIVPYTQANAMKSRALSTMRGSNTNKRLFLPLWLLLKQAHVSKSYLVTGYLCHLYNNRSSILYPCPIYYLISSSFDFSHHFGFKTYQEILYNFLFYTVMHMLYQ